MKRNVVPTRCIVEHALRSDSYFPTETQPEMEGWVEEAERRNVCFTSSASRSSFSPFSLAFALSPFYSLLPFAPAGTSSRRGNDGNVAKVTFLYHPYAPQRRVVMVEREPRQTETTNWGRVTDAGGCASAYLVLLRTFTCIWVFPYS